MNAKDVIREAVELSYMVTQAYLADLGEDDLVVRSVHWAQRTLGRPEAEDLGPDE